MERTTNTVLLIGRPGSGKGTQAKLLADAFGWKHFSTGNIFKEMREGEGALAAAVREAYDSGKIFPDWFATYLFEHAFLNLPATDGVVCEGYPRTLPQVEIFNETLAWLGRSYAVFNLEVPPEESMQRQLSRAQTEHRPDSSSEEKIRARLAQYDELTEPVLRYFRDAGKLIELDGTPSIEAIHADIISHLS